MPRAATSTLVDTSALLALANPRDQYHDRAVETAHRIIKQGQRLVGTTLVLAELHAHLLPRADEGRARVVVGSLLDDPIYEWLDVPVTLVQAAHGAWLERFRDQHFTLTDAVSFEVMQRRGIGVAFAYDRHFEIAGFRLL